MASNKPDADPYLAALRLLAVRDYTVAGIGAKLSARGFSDEAVNCAVDSLIAAGFVDDRRYAERFVELSRSSGRYVGYRLRQELKRRGIPSDVAAAVLSERQEPSAELEVARNLVQRRYGSFSSAVATDQERRRIFGFLQRRGFSSEIIWKVLDRTVYMS